MIRGSVFYIGVRQFIYRLYEQEKNKELRNLNIGSEIDCLG